METIILSLGGSLIVPEQVDVEFLKLFRSLVISQIEKGKKFVIITGGGKISRNYQEAAKSIAQISSNDLDWLGIAATRFNAELVKHVFGYLAESQIIMDPTLPIVSGKPVIIGGGWKPGFSTDHDAVLVGKVLGAKKIINLSNIDYAYDKDPNKFPEAKKIEEITWAEYRKLIPAEWNPGLSTPFDPVASELAQAENMEVNILNGKNISNLENCLEGKHFIGTKIY